MYSELFLLQAEQQQLSQFIFVGEVLQASDLPGLPLDLLLNAPVLLIFGTSELGTPGGIPINRRKGGESPPLSSWPCSS